MTTRLILNKLKMVLVIRGDLKLTKGKLASQTAHAAVTAYKKTLDRNPELAEKWFSIGQPKIVLKVESLTDLETLQMKLDDCDIISSLVLDAGLTQIPTGTATCLGIGPDYDLKINAIVNHLKLA